MIFKINQTDNPKLEIIYKQAIREYNQFFGIDWKEHLPRIFLVSDRRTIDSLRKRKSENWFIGWVGKGNDIYLLDPNNFEKESSHKYYEQNYFDLLRHELAHCFYNKISDYYWKPTWLFEGVSLYVSGQTKERKKPEKFVNFIKFYDNSPKEVYFESGFAVKFLVEKFGKEKILELIKRSQEAESAEKFAKLFKSIYGFELEYENFKII